MENKRASGGFTGTALGAVMTAIEGTHPEWFGNHPWILPLSLLVLLGSLLFWLTQYPWFQRMLGLGTHPAGEIDIAGAVEAASKNALAHVKSPEIAAPKKSRLKIIEARWGIEGINNPDVTHYLVEKQVADSFAEPISADLFRGFDPVGGNLNKKLKVRYSFDGREATVIRPEFAWLILPEDEFLKKQVEECRTFLGPLQFQLLDLAKRMQKMMMELPAPKPLDHATTSEETTAWMVRQAEWDQRIRYRYEGEFTDQINRLESSIGKDDLSLAHCLTEFNANTGRVMHPKDIEKLIHTLWDMARIIDGRS
jgi:hypothetical protein